MRQACRVSTSLITDVSRGTRFDHLAAISVRYDTIFFLSRNLTGGAPWPPRNITSHEKKDTVVSTTRRVISQRDRVGTKRNDVRRQRVRERPSGVVNSAEVRKKGREEDRRGRREKSEEGGRMGQGGGRRGQETNDGGPWLPRTTQ